MDTRDVRLPFFGQFLPPWITVQMIVSALLALVLIWIVFGSFFTVEPEEIGVVLRFGGYVRTAEPISGKIDYDLDGKLIGNWFVAGSGIEADGILEDAVWLVAGQSGTRRLPLSGQ